MRNKDKEYYKDRMETTSKDNGIWVNIMEKEIMSISLEKNSKVLSKMEKEMEKVK